MQDDDVVQALAANRADQALDIDFAKANPGMPASLRVDFRIATFLTFRWKGRSGEYALRGLPV
jgi:hypothetical protein